MSSSTRNPTHGQKVTDSNAPSIKEGAGAVASDSLAAESTRIGGDFAQNRNSEPQGVSGANSTFANQDTSGVVRLDPATDSEARKAQSVWAEERSSTQWQSKGLAVENTTIGGRGEGVARSDIDTAPSYVNSQYVDQGKPKGKNLTEGFEGGAGKNASFNNEIGTKNDPGRLAEQKFQEANADASEAAGTPRQLGSADGNEYATLDKETPA